MAARTLADVERFAPPSRWRLSRRAAAASLGGLSGAILVILTPVSVAHGTISGEHLANPYCPTGDYCPAFLEPPRLWLPPSVLVTFNWSSLNGTTLTVIVVSLAGPTPAGCYFFAITSGSCFFESVSGPDATPYEVEANEVAVANNTYGTVDYTFSW